MNDIVYQISIVMPVHNTGIYLEEALKTIFAQTFQNFELICVDDRSDDKLTRHILQSYQNQHENMQVIWMEKKAGAGNARNIGFSKVKGEYTIFLDADDLFADDFFERMYQCISSYNADVCLCGYEEFYIENEEKCFANKYIPTKYKVNITNREDWLLDWPMAPWNKLCRTQFLKTNNIYFQSLTSCNDVFFSCMVMIKAKKRCYVNDSSLISYRVNSKLQISSNRNLMDLYRAVTLLYYTMRENYNNERMLQWIGALLLRNGLLEMRKGNNEADSQEFYNCMVNFFMNDKINYNNMILMRYKEKIKENSFESKWYFNATDFLYQLRFVEKELKEKIAEEKTVFLWGLGYRGSMFQKFCKEQGINLQGVTDKKNNNVGQKTEYGYRILDTDYVLQSNGLIIASNCEIYEELVKKDVKLLKLSEYYVF